MRYGFFIAALLAAATTHGLAEEQQGEQSRLDAAEEEFLNGDVKETQRIIFQQLDVNEDGRLNDTEATQNRSLLLRFDKLDQDGDGTLDYEEFSDWRAFDEFHQNQ